MRNFTWNRFPIKFADRFLAYTHRGNYIPMQCVAFCNSHSMCGPG